ncbi:hypothetical protein [Pseudonocardia sp. HH130630-07]|uniref:hypothetical protein n=1 Tax=Pseudonocardia sp. HH130630-07 TaxID=1690815 RepID=UPI000A490A2B
MRRRTVPAGPAAAGRLSVSPKAVSKNINSIFDKLGLAPSDDDNRRVLAILAYLEHRG